MAYLRITMLIVGAAALAGCGDAGGLQPQPAPADPKPHSTRDQIREVTFFYAMDTRRRVTVRWTLDTYVNPPIKRDTLVWQHTEIARAGLRATLTVEQDEGGGFIECGILVANTVPLRPAGADWNPWQSRNDAGDCKASAVIP